MAYLTFMLVFVPAIIMILKEPDDMPDLVAKIVGWSFAAGTVLHILVLGELL